MRLEGDKPVTVVASTRTAGEVFMAWSPYLLLVVFVLVWGEREIKPIINQWGDSLLPGVLPTVAGTGPLAERLMVPGLHNLITRIPPVVPAAGAVRGALRAELAERIGDGVLLCHHRHRDRAARAAGSGRQNLRRYVQAAEAGAPHDRVHARPGLRDELLGDDVDARSGDGRAPAALFPFFSAVVGWLGVFLTGSDTSANALFGNLQVVTANALGLNPILTASVNSAAGVMGKMISIQSIAVAVAATGMTAADESRLFRFTIKHSVLLMAVMGVISMLFAYVFPGAVPVVPPK